MKWNNACEGATGRATATRSCCDRKFDNFAAAMAFVNRGRTRSPRRPTTTPTSCVHGWNKVRLNLTNHSEGGLTEADFALAQTIDALP